MSTSASSSPRAGQTALQLDGVKSYVSFNEPLIPFGGNFSVAVTFRATTPLPQVAELLSQPGSPASFYLGITEGQFIRAGDNWAKTTAVFPNDGEWHTLLLVRTQSATLLFLDGKKVASHPMAILNPAQQEFRIGRQYGNNGEYFKGEIAEVVSWKRDLSESEVSAFVPGALSATSPDLYALLRFETPGQALDLIAQKKGVINDCSFWRAIASEDGWGAVLPPPPPPTQVGLQTLTSRANLEPTSIGAVVGSMPFGQLIRSVAMSVAEAQTELDKNAMRVAEMFSGTMILRDPVTLLPLDANGKIPVRSTGGVFYSDDGKTPGTATPFEAAVTDTRVSFGHALDGTPIRVSMMELGFVPNFYQFLETLIEIKISVSLSKSMDGIDRSQGSSTQTQSQTSLGVNEHTQSFGGWWWNSTTSQSSYSSHSSVQALTTPVDASYSARYNYAVEASSLVRTRLVPIPPPPILEQRIRQLMELEQARETQAKTPTSSSSSSSTSSSTTTPTP